MGGGGQELLVDTVEAEHLDGDERARRREELLSQRAAARARGRVRGVRLRRPVTLPYPDGVVRHSA